MQIIQTLLRALTTENDVLTNFVCAPFLFVEIIIGMLLFTTILNIPNTKRQQIYYILAFSCNVLFSKFLIPDPFNVFINVSLSFFICYFIFKLSILKNVFAQILPYIFSVVTGIIITKIFMEFGINYNNVSSIPLYRIIFMLVEYTCLFLIFIFIKKFNLNITIVDTLSQSAKRKLIINSLFGIIAISTQLFLTSYYSDNLPGIVTLFGFVSLVAYFSISLYSLYDTNELQLTTESLEETKLYNKTLEILHDNLRGFRHDFNNIVSTIGGYIDTNDIEGLKKYYSQFSKDCIDVNNLSTLSPRIINNPAIYGLLASKYHKADEIGVKINFEILTDLNSLNVKIYELTRILGILLDNAIEATSNCKEKIINLIIRSDEKNNRQTILLENTYADKNIDTEKIFQKGYSTKPTNTGSGLWEVRKIISKSDNLNLYTSKTEKYFKQQLEIYNQKR